MMWTVTVDVALVVTGTFTGDTTEQACDNARQEIANTLAEAGFGQDPCDMEIVECEQANGL